jgi:hypothetical protein
VRADAPAEIMSFVPLTSLDAHDFSGAFQVVRIQIPSVIGAPEGIHADVLVGEDGLARAIRFPVDASPVTMNTYPWRVE